MRLKGAGVPALSSTRTHTHKGLVWQGEKKEKESELHQLTTTTHIVRQGDNTHTYTQGPYSGGVALCSADKRRNPFAA